MSNHSDYIPSADAEFDSFQLKLVANCVANKAGWNIPDAAVTKLENFQTPWTDSWAIARHKDTRSPADVLAKNQARDAYEPAIRKFVNAYVRYNPAITDVERKEMGINNRDTEPTPSPIPTTNPVLDIDTRDTGRHYVGFKDEHAEGRGRPFGTAYCEIRSAIGPEAPSHWNEYNRVENGHKSPAEFVYGKDFSGQKAHYIARWVNTRGQAGPWSIVYSAVIT